MREVMLAIGGINLGSGGGGAYGVTLKGRLVDQVWQPINSSISTEELLQTYPVNSYKAQIPSRRLAFLPAHLY